MILNCRGDFANSSIKYNYAPNAAIVNQSHSTSKASGADVTVLHDCNFKDVRILR